VLARLTLVVLAAGCLAVAVAGLDRRDDCEDAAASARSLRQGDVERAAAAASAVAAACDEPRAVAVASAFVANAGARDAAIGLARRLTRETPDAYVGWLALGRLLAPRDGGGRGSASRAALARAYELNPRGVPRPAPAP
jgi:hypothetical protein